MSLADVQSLIDAAKSAASDSLDDAKNYASLAQSAAATIVFPGTSGTIVWKKPTLPDPISGGTDLGFVFNTEAANAFAALAPDYLSKFTNYIDTYFPDVDGCIKANSDNWICDTIANGGTGIPAAIQNAIWQRAREAIAKDVAAQRDNAYTEYAGRGFSVPAGALTYRLMQIDQQAIDKSAEVARETAIKNIEIEIENIRFVVERAVQLRLGAVQAAINYALAYLKAYDSATERGKAVVAGRAQYWNTINAYYDAFARIEALDIEVKKGNIGAAQYDNDLFVKAASQSTRYKVEAALAAAQSLGSAAAAALGAQNTLANIGHITNS